MKGVAELAARTLELHRETLLLRRTIAAARLGRRTPRRIAELLAHARAPVYRSQVLKRFLSQRWGVHLWIALSIVSTQG